MPENHMQPVTQNPSEIVAPLHSLLSYELGLASPLGGAVETLDRASRLSFARQNHNEAARINRMAVARAVALGERPFDEESVREYDLGSVWVSDLNPQIFTAATMLVEDVTRQAKQAAGLELVKHAGPIFDVLAAEGRKQIETLRALPAPPRGVFDVSDPGTMLTRAPEHAATYSVIMNASDRFWNVVRGAELVRPHAGHGYERLPDGAPRLAYVYRNWRVAMEKQDDLRRTARHFRLWRTVVDGWEPGVWKPADVATTAADRSFSGKMRNLGSAVGIPSGQG